MQTNESKIKEISRKKFLRTVGSVVAGGAVVGMSGALISRKAVSPGKELSLEGIRDAFVSPYKQVSSFSIPGDLKAFSQYGDRLYVAVANAVFVYDYYGKRLHQFPVGEVVRDMAVGEEGVYLLYPAKVEVYTLEGQPLREWEACSELSNYCSLALAPGFVFVTDMANKNICQYTGEGAFVRFITSPEAFVIPSLSFGIAYSNGYIYCSNSGRHRIERYTPEGVYAGSFGAPGGAPGLFTGCCNPVHLATANGEIITSEKGDPRISCYGSDGTFRSLLLDSRSLGGGHAAYDVKVEGDRLFVAGRDKVSVFRYDERIASASACSSCGVTCPLRNGINS